MRVRQNSQEVSFRVTSFDTLSENEAVLARVHCQRWLHAVILVQDRFNDMTSGHCQETFLLIFFFLLCYNKCFSMLKVNLKEGK